MCTSCRWSLSRIGNKHPINAATHINHSAGQPLLHVNRLHALTTSQASRLFEPLFAHDQAFAQASTVTPFIIGQVSVPVDTRAKIVSSPLRIIEHSARAHKYHRTSIDRRCTISAIRLNLSVFLVTPSRRHRTSTALHCRCDSTSPRPHQNDFTRARVHTVYLDTRFDRHLFSLTHSSSHCSTHHAPHRT